MQSRTPQIYLPSLGARVLIYAVCLVLAQPAALLAASLLTWSEHVATSNYLAAMAFFAPASIVLAFWIVRHQFIRIDDTFAVFAFTRYAIPRTRRVDYADVTVAQFVGGVIGLDNRPRPLMAFSTKRGEQLWVPLSTYTRKQIQDLMAALEVRGLKIARGS